MSVQQQPDKQALHQHCVELVRGKLADLEKQLSELADSVANETKSTAGDKYETARAMLHIEQDQVRRQLYESKAQLAVLQAIDPAQSRPVAGIGSLINLDGVWYYMSIALGRLQFDDRQIIVLSMQSPLGARLQGLEAGADIFQNGKSQRVLAVM